MSRDASWSVESIRIDITGGAPNRSSEGAALESLEVSSSGGGAGNGVVKDLAKGSLEA